MRKIEGEKAAASLLSEMKATAARMRSLILSMPPHDLLGYIYAQHILRSVGKRQSAFDNLKSKDTKDLINENQFLLEYVHAVLASDPPPVKSKFDENLCSELFRLSEELRQQAIFFAMASSAGTTNGAFGANTADIEFRIKSAWVMLRGNRYQVLEGEFYRYALAPHDDVLHELYGVGAAEIAVGFQAMADATRTGQANAISEMMNQFQAAKAFAADNPLGHGLKDWVENNAEHARSAGRAMDDMFRGGIANVSRHTMLPPMLLSDLAYTRGEDVEFFDGGDYSGTPYRTLPARKKPLIKLGSDYYAVDPCFSRDAGYRALLYNLLLRKPAYKKVFEERQKTMSEGAFDDILAAQFVGARVFREIYYKDPISKQWAENDTLILVDDVLFLVEAKAGAAATIASPAMDFGRHAQSVQDLVLKAYKQCERFFNYLNSADEVPIYNLVGGKFEECGRISRLKYRVMIPIGLTIESFSPFSTYCKELPQVKPLLGLYAFVSLSIDELFVLNRFLPTAGAFSHYMEVRQAVAGIRGAHLFDEFDHLGAYIRKNRFDKDIEDQLRGGTANMLVWDGMSDVIDRIFESEDWETRPFPRQHFPEELTNLLCALDTTRAPGWLSVDSYIRDIGEEGRNNLSKILCDYRRTLDQYPTRYFAVGGGDIPLFICLHHHQHEMDRRIVNDKASAAAIAAKVSTIFAVLVEVGEDGSYLRAQVFDVQVPVERTEENAHIYEDAAEMGAPLRSIQPKFSKKIFLNAKVAKPGRNDPCPCDSGVKYKRCHGR